MADMLDIQNLSAGYGAALVLHGVTLRVGQGELVALVGANGAGKTTLLKTISGLIAPRAGTAELAGRPLSALSSVARVQLGLAHVPEGRQIFGDLSVAENIDLPLSYKDIPRSERQALVADTLDKFNIVGKKDLFPSQLSGGQQQLVGIARAVIHRPSLLLADEPTGNLHSAQAKEIMELFRKLNQEGTTIVQVTHSEENARYGSRIVELRDGWLYSDTAGLARTATAGAQS